MTKVDDPDNADICGSEVFTKDLVNIPIAHDAKLSYIYFVGSSKGTSMI